MVMKEPGELRLARARGPGQKDADFQRRDLRHLPENLRQRGASAHDPLGAQRLARGQGRVELAALLAPQQQAVGKGGRVAREGLGLRAGLAGEGAGLAPPLQVERPERRVAAHGRTEHGLDAVPPHAAPALKARVEQRRRGLDRRVRGQRLGDDARRDGAADLRELVVGAPPRHVKLGPVGVGPIASNFEVTAARPRDADDQREGVGQEHLDVFGGPELEELSVQVSLAARRLELLGRIGGGGV
jgi:hypothetical protein